MASTDPFAMNEDGTAQDPAAFKDALKADKAKMDALKEEPEVMQIIEGDDMNAFQELLRSVYQVRCFLGT